MILMLLYVYFVTNIDGLVQDWKLHVLTMGLLQSASQPLCPGQYISTGHAGVTILYAGTHRYLYLAGWGRVTWWGWGRPWLLIYL